MASFVLVHGAWHGGWCWGKVVRALEAAGHEVRAPDLPGHGEDATSHERVDLQAYSDRICDAVDSLSGEVVAVGHSLGGLTISQVAEHRSDRLRSLVFLAAFIPGLDGNTIANTGVASPAIRTSVRPSEDGHSLCFELAAAREVFYADCSDDDVEFARERLCPQPQAVFRSSLALSDEGYGSVPRDYILCAQDAAILSTEQQRMIDRESCRNVYTMNCSHSPFFSAPEELAKILGEIADS
jgi:pimeloyl-ACP methyl ester carboxylesterase